MFRLNFSHGTHEDHRRRAAAIREIEDRCDDPVGIFVDLQGPKLRFVALGAKAACRLSGMGSQGCLERTASWYTICQRIPPGNGILAFGTQARGRESPVALPVARARKFNLLQDLGERCAIGTG